jgi:hypothetical protein
LPARLVERLPEVILGRRRGSGCGLISGSDMPSCSPIRIAPAFWPLFLAGSEPNRRMTDAAHNQHSETRRPSDRDAPSVPRF